MRWSDILSKEACDIAMDLQYRAEQERIEGAKICPPQDKIMRAFALTPPENVKVVIVGQDPYHSPGTANGLAFSTDDDVTPPSLRNIFRELVDDVGVCPMHNDLTAWAKEGVLLINAALTVYEHQANSHANWGWYEFTQEVIHAVGEFEQPVVFLLWGAFAQKLANYIPGLRVVGKNGELFFPNSNKLVINSSHPSPLSAFRGSNTSPAFIGSRPFSRANQFLIDNNVAPMNWEL